MTVYILFPHLAMTHDKFVSLTKEQLTRWLDQVFHPVIHCYCESVHHYCEDQPALAYYLAPEYLDQIWTEILWAINDTPGLHDFRDAQLFFNAKGTVLVFKTSTLLDALENFQGYFKGIMDLDFVFLDRFYVNIGKEICLSVSLLAHQRPYIDDEAQVYLWKRCCFEHYLCWLYDGRWRWLTLLLADHASRCLWNDQLNP